MSETVAPSAAGAVDDRRPRAGQRRRWDRIRWALILGWLALLVALPFTSERTGSWNELEQLVRSGDVSTVTISSELGPGDLGMAHVQVHWRHHGIYRVATVVQVRGRGYNGVVASAARHGYDARTVAPGADLTSLRPGLEVKRDYRHTNLDDPIVGFHGPYALGLAVVGLWLGGLVILILGPEPWRATRWAWFWLLWSPIGAAAFVLLSGPTRPIPWPRKPNRRLTGGWALLIRVLLSSVTILGFKLM